jgi:outer membrane protein assembly factor BamB
MRYLTPCLLFLLFASIAPVRLQADDWPQWLGPQRDGVWREKGIVRQFPQSGLPIKWRVPVALGYSGPAVAGGKVFVPDYQPSKGSVDNNPGGRGQLEGAERLLCLDAATGRLLWKHEYQRTYNISYPSGPRCTPTVEGGRVYWLGAEGDLVCLEAASGRVVWTKNLTAEYKTATPIWGYAAHPLVIGDLLYCLAGGEGSVAVAFDKNTGREVWRALSATEPGYCPPTVIEHAGIQQLLIWHPQSLNSLSPRTGEVYWNVPLAPLYGMSVTAPRQAGSHLFAGGIGNAAALLKLDDKKPAAEVVWRGNPKNAVYCANSTPHIVEGTIYGCDCQLGALMAVRLSDGERLWQTFEPTAGGDRRVSHGTVFLVQHEDRFFLFSETGDLILARLTPERYEELGRTHILEPTNEAFGRPVVWSHPAFAGKCVFARNDKELVCVDLAAKD